MTQRTGRWGSDWFNRQTNFDCCQLHVFTTYFRQANHISSNFSIHIVGTQNHACPRMLIHVIWTHKILSAIFNTYVFNTLSYMSPFSFPSTPCNAVTHVPLPVSTHEVTDFVEDTYIIRSLLTRYIIAICKVPGTSDIYQYESNKGKQYKPLHLK